MQTKIYLSSVLKREMKNRGIGLSELSLATGVPKSTLHGWLNGSLPSGRHLHFILKLSSYFEISIGELLFNMRERPSRWKVISCFEFDDLPGRFRIIIEKLQNP